MEFVTSLIQTVATAALLIVLLIMVVVVGGICMIMSPIAIDMMRIMQTPLPY